MLFLLQNEVHLCLKKLINLCTFVDLALFFVGYPVLCFVILMRAFVTPQSGGILGWLSAHFKVLRSTKLVMHATSPHDGAMTSEAWSKSHKADDDTTLRQGAELSLAAASLAQSREETVGYLFMGLRSQHPVWRVLTSFPAQMIFAIVNNTSSSTNLHLFILGLVSALTMVSILYHSPFTSTLRNLRLLIAYSITLGHVCLMMLSSDTKASAQSPYFLVLMGLWVRTHGATLRCASE